MSRLPTLTAKQLRRVLLRDGFVEIRQRGSHLTLYHSGRDVQTVVPMHAGDVKRGLLSTVLKQAKLSEEEFRQLL